MQNFKSGDRVNCEGYGEGTVVSITGYMALVKLDSPNKCYFNLNGYPSTKGVCNKFHFDDMEITDVPEPSAEPQYVRCKDDSVTITFTKGKIYTWPQPIDDRGEERVHITIFQYWSDIFERATKEQFDHQNKRKVVLTTVDGRDIYQNDTYWIFDPAQRNPRPFSVIARHGPSVGALTFSTEFAAKCWLYKQNNPTPAPMVYPHQEPDFVATHKDGRKFVFTTKDGVHMYFNDEYYIIPKDDSNYHNYFRIVSAVIGPSPNSYGFSTREAAEAYLESIKPKPVEVRESNFRKEAVLSIDDVAKVFRSVNSTYKGAHSGKLDELLTLVKQKLNKQ